MLPFRPYEQVRVRTHSKKGVTIVLFRESALTTPEEVESFREDLGNIWQNTDTPVVALYFHKMTFFRMQGFAHLLDFKNALARDGRRLELHGMPWHIRIICDFCHIGRALTFINDVPAPRHHSLVA